MTGPAPSRSSYVAIPPTPIAIVGMSAIMPEAQDAEAFWANIIGGRYCITDVPPERWDPALYYDADRHAPGKTYSTIGGWVREYPWDPFAWRLPLPPRVSEQLDVGQRWSVSLARQALLDFGWPNKPMDTERTAVIIGNAIGGEKHYATSMRIQFPEFERELRASPTFETLPEGIRESVIAEAHQSFDSLTLDITEDTMPGELPNIIAGRVANLFNLRGPNFTTDAACASGLAAMSAASHGLAAGEYDTAIAGGVDRNNGIAAFVKFCKIGALSATGTRPFDAGADGFVMGEGGALFILKRLADAERDGDDIHAVVLSIGGSSDGKGKGITAPNPVGQRLAVERAWDRAGVNPATIGLLEAHGTSTRVGDVSEAEALTAVLVKAGAAPGSIPLGSVKSNIGHLKAAAGVAGLFKAVRALSEKVLPPSINVTTPNPAIDWAGSPLKVNRELREWPLPACGARVAGVSAFGFGGSNFHVALEEYVPGRHRDDRSSSFAGADIPGVASATPAAAIPASATPAKAPLRGALLVGAADDQALASRLEQVGKDAATLAARPPAAPLSADLRAGVRVAIDFAGAAELADKAGRARDALLSGQPVRWRPLRSRGVFLGRGPAPKMAFLFTGQGSQYVNMLKTLHKTEPLVAGTFTEADAIMTPLLGRPLTDYIYADESDPAAVARHTQELLQTEITQPAVLTVDAAMSRLLGAYGIHPDMVMGHSLGEYAALVAAGSLTVPAALEAVSARGREMANISVEDNGAMAAVMAPLEEVQRIVDTAAGYVVVANVNSSRQAVIGGATPAVEETIRRIVEAGGTAVRLPVSHAFHTSIVAPASAPLREQLRRLNVQPPRIPLVANVDGAFYPTGPDSQEAIIDILGRQIASPVQFVKGLQTLYDAGARVFVEVGPKKALHGFAEDVLGQHEDVQVLFTNHPKFGEVISFNQALCGLYAAGLGTSADATSPPDVTAVATASNVNAAIQQPRPAVATRPEASIPSTPSRDVSGDRYRDIGMFVADIFDRGRQLFGAPAAAGNGRPLDSAPVVISGVSLGLPGGEHVFDDANVGRILSGQQFIDAIPLRFRRRILEKNITRLVKSDDGSASWLTLSDESEVIKLAGRAGALDAVTEFGIDPNRDAAIDSVTRLAIGAGIDALRDAGIPLVLHYRTTSIGTELPDRWMLPHELRDDTGIIFATAFPGAGEFSNELERFFTYEGRRHELESLVAIRARAHDGDAVTAELERRIRELRATLESDPYIFDRRFLFRVLSMGHSQFAEIVGARGPNTQVNAACASTTQAIGFAEDWIKAGRCRRVLVVSADDVSNDYLMDWVGAGFLATGAAATDERVEDAALPFDNRRHGLIIGMGAAAFVVESAAAARERGIAPLCEVLATVTANSAFHGTRLDVDHIALVMEGLVASAEAAHGIRRADIAGQTMLMSHETYTPARGGSAAAEVNALREVFGEAADAVVVTNTKGFTGHAMGAGIEDAVAVKALETGLVPPIPNFRDVDPALGALNLSHGGEYPLEYALRLAAGFGSQVSMSLLRHVPSPTGARPRPDQLGFRYRVADEAKWRNWLQRVSGMDDPQLEVVQRRLRVADPGLVGRPPVPSRPATVPAAPPRIVATPRPVAVAPVLAPPAPAPAAPIVPVVPAGDLVAQQVLSIVADKTGYPSEMLDLDLDLEADLGVDTVKQAEVFAAVRDVFDIPRDDNLQLRDYPTLSAVIGFVRDRSGLLRVKAGGPATDPAGPSILPLAAGGSEAPPTDPGFPPPPAGDLAAANAVPRRVPVPVLRPPLGLCKPTGVVLDGSARVVLAADGGGVGHALAKRLAKLGVTVLRIEAAADAAAIITALDGWLADGPVTGVYWLPALDDEGPVTEMDLATWHEALRVRVKNLYATTRRLASGSPFLVTATRLGGRHGYDAAGATCPLGGAVTGFAKAYKREQPDALVKAVDFAAGRRTAGLADVLVDETLRDTGCVEVGVDDTSGGAAAANGGLSTLRWGIGLEERPATDGTPPFDLNPGSVYVISGAAGSIVSAICADLARSGGGGVFHLLDLTPAPDPEDSDLRRFVTDREGLKTELIARMNAGGKKVTPVLVEKELAQIERLAMAETAIAAVRNAGGTAHYHCVDLTDADAVAREMAAVAAQHGHVDVLLHAAGVEISHRLEQKEPREYDLVFGVKSDGWFNLLRALRDIPLGATVAFSSVAGRFGNAGQTDYSAANDLLCKLTSNLRRSRPDVRGIVIDWTAWGGIGMATRGSIPTIMAAAGIDMLPSEAGIATIRRELTAGGTRGEVLVAGRLGMMMGEFDSTGGLDPSTVDLSAVGPMVGRVTGMGIYTGLTTEVDLDPAGQPFLDHHRIDGTAVLPGVMGIEGFAEVACLLLPGWSVTAVDDVSFREPVKFYRDEPRTLTLSAVLTEGDPASGEIVAACRLSGSRHLATSPEPVVTEHFTARVRLSTAPLEAEHGDAPPEPGTVAVAAADLYQVYFHGPAYQVLDRAWLTDTGVAGLCFGDLPDDHVPADRELSSRPRLIELCFQTAGLLGLAADGVLGLPNAIDWVSFAAYPLAGSTAPGLVALAKPRGDEAFDARVVDAQGRTVLRLEGYRTVAFPAPVPAERLEPLRRAMG